MVIYRHGNGGNNQKISEGRRGGFSSPRAAKRRKGPAAFPEKKTAPRRKRILTRQLESTKKKKNWGSCRRSSRSPIYPVTSQKILKKINEKLCTFPRLQLGTGYESREIGKQFSYENTPACGELVEP